MESTKDSSSRSSILQMARLRPSKAAKVQLDGAEPRWEVGPRTPACLSLCHGRLCYWGPRAQTCTLRSPSPFLASEAESQTSVHFSEERISTAFVGFLDSLYLLAPKCFKKNKRTAGTHCWVQLVSIPPPGGREPLQPPPHWEASSGGLEIVLFKQVWLEVSEHVSQILILGWLSVSVFSMTFEVFWIF